MIQTLQSENKLEEVLRKTKYPNSLQQKIVKILKKSKKGLGRENSHSIVKVNENPNDSIVQDDSNHKK